MRRPPAPRVPPGNAMLSSQASPRQPSPAAKPSPGWLSPAARPSPERSGTTSLQRNISLYTVAALFSEMFCCQQHKVKRQVLQLRS